MRLWMRWSACLCLSLMLWTAAVESTHTHPSQTEANSCPICVVAHTARPAVTTAQSTPLFIAVGLFQEESIVRKARVEVSHLGIRGPPVAL